MSAGELIGLIVIVALIGGAFLVASTGTPPCDHTLEPRKHEGRIYLTCRCGERFNP